MQHRSSCGCPVRLADARYSLPLFLSLSARQFRPDPTYLQLLTSRARPVGRGRQAYRWIELMGVASVLLASIILSKAHAFAGVGFHSSSTSSSSGRSLTHAVTSLARRWSMGTPSFRTEVHVPVWPEHAQLGYADSFFLLGSCFSDNISQHLRRAKLPTSLNPAHGASIVSRRLYGGTYMHTCKRLKRRLFVRCLSATCEAVWRIHHARALHAPHTVSHHNGLSVPWDHPSGVPCLRSGMMFPCRAAIQPSLCGGVVGEDGIWCALRG